jgi:hypothetical protein
MARCLHVRLAAGGHIGPLPLPVADLEHVVAAVEMGGGLAVQPVAAGVLVVDQRLLLVLAGWGGSPLPAWYSTATEPSLARC